MKKILEFKIYLRASPTNIYIVLKIKIEYDLKCLQLQKHLQFIYLSHMTLLL
jgi:hypothetical protein